MKNYNVLYDGDGEGLHTNIGKGGNIMILVRSGSYVFGGYWKDELIRVNNAIISYNSSDSFVFSLNNYYGVNVNKIKKYNNQKENLLINCSIESDEILSIPFFLLIKKNDCFINNKFSMYWNVKHGFDAKLFCGKVFPERFTLSEILVLKWSK